MSKRYLKLANDFLQAKTAEEALQYTHATNPDEFNKAFTVYHKLVQSGKLGSKVHSFAKSMNQFALIPNEGVKNNSNYIYIYWDKDKSAPKVDWKASYGYNEVSWEEFKKSKPELGVEMRVILETSNYYNYSFSDDEIWLCYKIYRGEEAPIYAYIRRDNAQSKKIINELSRKNAGAFTVKIAYPEGKKQDDQVEILEVINTTWFDTQL